MEMIKFEMEVLIEYNYSELLLTNLMLNKAKKIANKGKEFAREHGKLMSAVDWEKKIIRINENLDSVGIMMMSKEAECFDLSGKYETMCLN
jgi:hypothetical protein|tara:strand:+ start:473 stop:745 length:273 start_codon:yes stop_codon:yes gene_type:complete